MVFVLALLLSLETVILSPPNQEVVPIPSVENFSIVLSKELEFRVDNCKTGFLGRVVVYQNPNDMNEFVRVYYRQVAIVSERACENNMADGDSLNRNSSSLNYHQKKEVDTLDRVQKATDAFAFIQWRTVRDPRTGQDIRDGTFHAWLLDQNGNWVFSYGYDLERSPFSEPSKANPKKLVLVGIRFSLAGKVHIVRIDQDDISNLVKGATNEK